MKIDYQNPFVFSIVALFLMIIWGLIGYYIIPGIYFVVSFLFYLGIFLLGMLFKVRNGLFIPVTYLLVYCSDFVSRMIIDTPRLQLQPLFILLIFYNIELIIISITTINLDAKNYEWDAKKKRTNKRIALILPILSLCVYYLIIKQVFKFE